MRWRRTLQIVEVHCEGEVGQVVTGGVLDLPGGTVLEKLDYINRVDDSLRRFLVFEPRGMAQMSVNLLLPPTREHAQAAFIVLQSDRAHAMSGSNAICVATALLETGMVPMAEPESTLRLDTAAGLVTATAQCCGGRCESVALDMPASYVEALDVVAGDTPFGEVRADIAYGGVFYALVDVDQVGLQIAPENARALAEAGAALNRAFNAHLEVRHPVHPEIAGIAYVMFRDRDPDGAVRTCTTLLPGRVDRSPCGTGTSAQLAVMHACGVLGVGGRVTARSIIGGTFEATLLDETTIAGRPAIIPRISGRAWIHGLRQVGLDPTDPFPEGFALSDCWGAIGSDPR